MQIIEFGMSATRAVANQKSVFTDPVCNLTTSRLKGGPRNGGAEVLVALTLLRRTLKVKEELTAEVSSQRHRCPKSGSQFSTTPLF